MQTGFNSLDHALPAGHDNAGPFVLTANKCLYCSGQVRSVFSVFCSQRLGIEAPLLGSHLQTSAIRNFALEVLMKRLMVTYWITGTVRGVTAS